jgi:hypothetical protein
MSDLPAVVHDGDLVVSRPPDIVLEEARKAAAALQSVIANKPKKVIIRGEQYLEYEDWATCGRFYGVTAKIEWSRPVDENCMPIDANSPLIPSGFEARAVVVNSSGMEVSAAEALCMRSEEQWADRPIFQLKSMAQTRACSKALRNVLAWVVVLAGYRATPAEEMIGDERGSRSSGGESRKVSEGQGKLIYVLLKKAGHVESAKQKATVIAIIGRTVEHLTDLTADEASKVIDSLQQAIRDAGGTP